MYNVVFEYTQEAGGFTGIRTWTTYNDKGHFHRVWVADPKQNVLIEGVSDEEAVMLTAKTPEISRIKAAIEESYLGDTLDTNLLLQAHLPKAVFAIQMDRQKTERPSFYVTHLSETSTSLQGKESLFAAIETCASPDGRVDLGMISSVIKIPLLVIIFNQCNLP